MNLEHLESIDRVRINEDRDLVNGLRLNRNERVENWSDDFINDIFKSVPKYAFSIYPDHTKLYSKISNFIDFPESNILVTSGIDGSIRALFEVFTSPGDLVGVLGPTYAMYYVYGKIFRLKLSEVSYNFDTLSINVDDIIRFFDLKPKMFFIPNPNQPIEDPLSLKDLEYICSKAAERDIVICIDEAYHHFGCPTALPLVRKFQNVVVMRTFSKAFGVPSIRLGFSVSNERFVKILSAPRLAYESNFFSDTIAIYLLDNFHLIENHIKKTNEGRDYLKKELGRINIKSYGDVANYLLIDFESPDKCAYVYNELLRNKIYVKGNYKDHLARYILVTCGPIVYMKEFVSIVSKAIY